VRNGRGRTPGGAKTAGSGTPRATIAVAWDGVRRFVPDAAVRAAVRAARAHGGRPDMAASIVFVTDRSLSRMHARHLGDASRTDVITFDLCDAVGGPLVEVYASAERARSVAARRKVAPRRELLLYVVHGVLHLCGFDDHSRADRARMRDAETAVLTRLGYAVDHSAHDE
jgi:probable rRNA maturation factor